MTLSGNKTLPPLMATISLAVSAATFSTAVTAQDPAAAEIRVLEEVIVTAQKRAESSQDVPVALTAIGSATLESMGINQTQDLTRLSSSLTLKASNSKQNSAFSLRGIGTQVYSIGVEQSVAVIIDDVSTVQAGQAISNLVDIERIEILRGPQSTLFGKSASAGVLSVVTRRPAEELEGSVEVTLTDENSERVLASISGPITDSLGYRLTGHWSDQDGFINNLTIDEDVNSSESKGLRGKLQWDITDSVDALLTVYYSEDESTCCAATWLDLDPDARFFGIIPEEVAPGITPSDDNLDFRSEDGPEDDTENSGASLRFNAGFGEFTFVSITAVDEWEYNNIYDVDLSNVDVQGFFTGGAEQGGIHQESHTKTDFFSQEFRLTSPSYEKYDYLVGLYYADADTDRTFQRNSVLAADWAGTAGTESLAVFGQMNWRFSEALVLTAGLRWNDEEISADFENFLIGPESAIKTNDSDSVWVGNVSLQYFLMDDGMLYARYAEGYKGQAYDLGGGFDEFKADNPAEPETSDSFEVGYKSMLMDGRLQLNVAAFYTEYENYQGQALVLDEDGAARATLNNVGELETQGVELESTALIGNNLTLNFNLAYVDATMKEFVGTDCYAGQTEEEGCIDGRQDASGGDLPNSPDWKWNLRADYIVEMASMPFDGFLNFSYMWQDEVQFRLDQNPLSVYDSYGVADFSLGINERDSDRYRVTLFVNNITDENYSSNITDWRQLFGGKMSLTNVFTRNSQRYYGIRVKYNF